MKFEYNEVISKIGVHSNHFEIWKIVDGKKLKMATAFQKHNALLIIEALRHTFT